MSKKCKTCQFRYADTDHSKITVKNNLNYKVTDCSFDPMTNVWS